MKRSALLIFLLATPCYGQYVVVNKMPQFTVVNRCDPFAIEAKAPPRKVQQIIVTSTRAPQGHTHTCPKCGTTRAPQGHTHTCPKCGTTWDHAANPTHNCANCGTTVVVIDRPSRPVTVRRMAPVPIQPAARSIPQVIVTTPAIQRSVMAYQNCPPGG